MNKDFAKLPSINLIDEYLAKLGLPFGLVVRSEVQKILGEFRSQSSLLSNASVTKESLLATIADRISAQKPAHRVINATGVILHTNLGRALIHPEIAAKAMQQITGYQNLEFDAQRGKRGKRGGLIQQLLCSLTGAEDVLIVNNNAAAVMLALHVFGQEKETIVSRGELVEIGGSFRIPEVMQASGTIMKEVGTTNKTHLKDYEAASSPQTAIFLKVHCSNFEIQGFTHNPSREELAKLAGEKDVLFLEDLGSGFLHRKEQFSSLEKDSIQACIKAGVDLVTFSGDKLLGGPQAGIIAGKKKYIEKLKSAPMYRALRCDKVTLTLLEETLLSYAKGQEYERIPTYRMLFESEEKSKERALEILTDLPEENFTLRRCKSTPGGGALPTTEIASYGIYIHFNGVKPDHIQKALRGLSVTILGYIKEGKVILDCRTIQPQEVTEVASLLQSLHSLVTQSSL